MEAPNFPPILSPIVPVRLPLPPSFPVNCILLLRVSHIACRISHLLPLRTLINCLRLEVSSWLLLLTFPTVVPITSAISTSTEPRLCRATNVPSLKNLPREAAGACFKLSPPYLPLSPCFFIYFFPFLLSPTRLSPPLSAIFPLIFRLFPLCHSDSSPQDLRFPPFFKD